MSNCDVFKNHNSSYFLRQSDFSVPRYNTVTYGKHSFSYLGPKLADDGCKGCSLCSSTFLSFFISNV